LPGHRLLYKDKAIMPMHNSLDTQTRKSGVSGK
jgi:hypothetical protein